MSNLDATIVDEIKLVGNLSSMGEKETATIIGEKIIASLGENKDGFLFPLCYDLKKIEPKNDVSILLDAIFLATCLEKLYQTFKNITGGSKAQYWFNSGDNNTDLHRFFLFLARDNKSLDLKSDISIISNAIKALKKNPTYKIPSGLSQYDMNRFFLEIYQGKIQVTKDGVR